MIKNLTQTLFTALFFALLIACGTKKEAEEWKAMDDFHMIMAESFHPFKDSANLAPARAKAAEMAASAEQWLATPLPEKVNNENVKAKLEALKVKTAAFVETSKSTDDKVVGDALTELHDMFHELQETWYGGHGEHHH